MIMLAIGQIGELYGGDSPNQKKKKAVNKNSLPVGFYKCVGKMDYLVETLPELGRTSLMHFNGENESGVTEYLWISQSDTMVIIIVNSDDFSVINDYMVAKLNYNKNKPLRFKSKVLDYIYYTLVGSELILSSERFSEIKFAAFYKITGTKRANLGFVFHNDLSIQNDDSKLMHEVVLLTISRNEFVSAIKQIPIDTLNKFGLEKYLSMFLQ